MSIHGFLERTEAYAVEIIHGRNKTTGDRLFRMFLFSLSQVYRDVTQARLHLYEMNYLPRTDLGSYVVSVGNLTAGGTGKTPVVELLARRLMEQGRNVAILSRGYRSKSVSFWEKLKRLICSGGNIRKPKVVSDGIEVKLTSWDAGDEPYMLACNLCGTPDAPGVAVVVDKDRVLAGRHAISEFHSDTLILDDGFQYLRLRPRTNIVLVDASRPFSNHNMLPVGLLREPIVNIARADYVFLTKCRTRKNVTGGPLEHPEKSLEALENLEAFIHKHNSKAPIILCNHEPKLFKRLGNSNEEKELGWLKGHKVAAICGIAVPESFEGYLKELGGTLVHTEHFVDHHRYVAKEIKAFCQKAREAGADVLVTTEKDAVRIPEETTNEMPFFFLKIEISIIKGQENFEDCIRTICGK